MSHTIFDHSIEDLARLEREAESKELELRQIRAQMAAARQRSIATAAHNTDFLSTSQSNFQFSPLPPSAPQDAGLRATARHGDLTAHNGPQTSVRAVHRPAQFGQYLTWQPGPISTQPGTSHEAHQDYSPAPSAVNDKSKCRHGALQI